MDGKAAFTTPLDHIEWKTFSCKGLKEECSLVEEVQCEASYEGNCACSES